VPSCVAVFGLEHRSRPPNPTVWRAACVIKPLPFYWLGELSWQYPGADPDRDTGSQMSIYSQSQWDPKMHAMFEMIRNRYALLSKVAGYGWQVFEGDDRALLAYEMLDVAEREEVPERGRIAMAARLIERASRVPGRVAFNC